MATAMVDRMEMIAILECCPRTLTNWVKRGCPAIRTKPFGKLLFAPDAVIRWASNNQYAKPRVVWARATGATGTREPLSETLIAPCN